MVYFIIGFIVGAVLMLVALAIAAMGKDDETSNKVHFYVARDKHGKLWLYLNKPIRFDENIWVSCKQGCSLCIGEVFKNIGLNEADYKDLEWEDEPVEVFLNLED